MKLHFWLILWYICFWVVPDAGIANSNTALIEHFPLGQIDWTHGVITAKGTVSSQSDHFMIPQRQVLNSAFEQAVQNLINILVQLRVDDQRCASHIFVFNKGSRDTVEAMARSAKVVLADTSHGNLGEIAIRMSIFGGFAQLMLPAEIRQVQPIKPLSHAITPNHLQMRDADASESYTGLIVDARGTGAKPSMVPTLVDENGHAVFGPAYVSREYAVQYGVCQYQRRMNREWSQSPRVAPNPLMVKGLRTVIPKGCNIVISNADASKLRGSSTHLDFLKQCRVIIVLD